MPTIPKTNILKKKPTVKKSAHENNNWSSNNETRYNTTRWRKSRLSFLKRNPCCVSCKERGIFTPANVVDHIVPVSQGGEFWDRSNWQPMCASCHNTKSGKERHNQEKGEQKQKTK